MVQPPGRSTRVSTTVHAPRETVYRALVESRAVETWLAPDAMRGKMHVFEPRAGGVFRMSLTYVNEKDAGRGKSSDDADTFEGHFVELVPNEKIVQVVEFESDRREFAGKMKITWSLADTPDGTEVTSLFENIPVGIRLEDNELGTRQSLRKLADFVEHGNADG